MSSVKRLFWDIETSPNVVLTWRCGYKQTVQPHQIVKERAIICICYKWEGKKKVHSLTWDNGDDSQMLKEFISVASQADELVAHNGDNFDLPWVQSRCLIHGLDPLHLPKSVDTLKIAKKHFYLNSNKLDYIAKLLFGNGNGKTKTDFSLWGNITLFNCPKSMKKMVKYCKNDVVILENVWGRLRDYEIPAIHAAVQKTGNDKDRWMCPHCGSPDVRKSKTRVTAKGMVQHQMKCNGCGHYYSIANNVFGWYLRAAERN